MTNNNTIPRISLFQYSFLAIPLAFAGLPLYIHVPDFYATTMGFSLSGIGIVIILVRVFDAVQDPLIGHFCDLYHNKRSEIMFVACLLMAVGFIMLFHPQESLGLAGLAISLVLATTAFSILVINLNALGSKWRQDKTEKSRITSWREALGLIGLIIASILPSVITFSQYSYVLLIILVFAYLLFINWYTAYQKNDLIGKENSNEATNENTLKTSQRSIKLTKLLSRSNIWFFGIYFVSTLASAIPAVLIIFFTRDLLNAEQYTGAFLLLYFLSGASGMTIWIILSKRSSKLVSWVVAMLLATATFVWAFFLQSGDIWQYAIICLLSGIALGGELSLPPAILSELIDAQNKSKNTSFLFSILAFLSKAALALGSGLAFLILGATSFSPATQNDSEALLALSFTYALAPCIIKLCAVLGLLSWLRQLKQREDHAYSSGSNSYFGGHNDA
ncbi:MFS transporter [Kiloniella majae]|uniref:MFS transporter n=1 Tax=Kiloniella majae TaxID=1938558 RepID=UPI000A27884D|nr:MFS transporter [Kiloniella majae]